MTHVCIDDQDPQWMSHKRILLEHRTPSGNVMLDCQDYCNLCQILSGRSNQSTCRHVALAAADAFSRALAWVRDTASDDVSDVVWQKQRRQIHGFFTDEGDTPYTLDAHSAQDVVELWSGHVPFGEESDLTLAMVAMMRRFIKTISSSNSDEVIGASDPVDVITGGDANPSSCRGLTPLQAERIVRIRSVSHGGLQAKLASLRLHIASGGDVNVASHLAEKEWCWAYATDADATLCYATTFDSASDVWYGLHTRQHEDIILRAANNVQAATEFVRLVAGSVLIHVAVTCWTMSQSMLQCGVRVALKHEISSCDLQCAFDSIVQEGRMDKKLLQLFTERADCSMRKSFMAAVEKGQSMIKE